MCGEKRNKPSVISGGIPPRKTFCEKWELIWYWSIASGSNLIGKYPRHEGIEFDRPALWTTCGCGWGGAIGLLPIIRYIYEEREKMWLTIGGRWLHDHKWWWNTL